MNVSESSAHIDVTLGTESFTAATHRFQRILVLEALATCDYSVVHAARLLRIHRTTLKGILHRHRLSARALRAGAQAPLDGPPDTERHEEIPQKGETPAVDVSGYVETWKALQARAQTRPIRADIHRRFLTVLSRSASAAVIILLLAGVVSAQTFPVIQGGLVGPPLTCDGTNCTLGSGQLFLPNGTAAATSLAFTNAPGAGFRRLPGLSDTVWHFDTSRWARLSSREGTFGLTLALGLHLGWANGTDSDASVADLFFYRDSAGTLAQRNGTNPQAFRLYNTYTDAANYERAFSRWNANVFEIGTEAAGTGTARSVRITTASPWTWDATGVTASGSLVLSTAGPHAIGGAITSQQQVTLTGTFTTPSAIGLAVRSTLDPTNNGYSYGVYTAPTFAKGTSGTHSLFAGTYLAVPVITAGAAALTETATLYVAGAPSGGTSNYAVHVATASPNVIDSSGNVGIGTTSPQQKLDVGGNVQIANGAQFRTATSGALENISDGIFRFSNGAGTDYSRLILGTNTVSGVSLTKNGTALETKLGDGSAYAQHAALVYQTTTALVALGGGVAPTLGTIGGSGPTVAAQNSWLLMKDSTGASFWVPAWK